MKKWKAVITAVSLVTSTHLAMACFDPILSTNTSLEVLKERYRHIKTGAAIESEHATGQSRHQVRRGAEELFASKEACFLYPNMRSQYEISCLAPLIRAYDALPKHTRRITTMREGKPSGVSVQIVGTGTNKTVLICIPGVMSDSTVFRFLVGAMAAEYYFWLIDPPGCGESEAPNPKYLGPGGYSPAALADRELQAIDACLRDCPKDVRVLILAHSLGGLVTLRAFGDPEFRAPYGHVLGRIQGLVLIAPGDVFMSQVSPVLASRADLSGLAVLVGDGLGVVREAVAQYLAGSFYASHCMPREEVDHGVQVIRNSGTREAFKGMLRDAIAFDRKTGKPNFFEMMAQERWYANVELPCEIIWGKCDQTVPVYVGYMLEHQLPNARLSVIPNCKHAPQLECPSECARFVREADRHIGARALARQGWATTLKLSPAVDVP